MSRAVSAGSPSSVTSSTSSFSPSSPLNHHLMDSSHTHNLSHHPHHVSHSLHHQVMGHHLHGNSQMFNPMNSSSVHLQSSHSSKGLNSTMNPNVITLLNSNNGTISSMTDPVSGGMILLSNFLNCDINTYFFDLNDRTGSHEEGGKKRQASQKRCKI